MMSFLTLALFVFFSFEFQLQLVHHQHRHLQPHPVSITAISGQLQSQEISKYEMIALISVGTPSPPPLVN